MTGAIEKSCKQCGNATGRSSPRAIFCFPCCSARAADKARAVRAQKKAGASDETPEIFITQS